MKQRLQELKENIISFVNNCNVERFDIYIDEQVSNAKSDKKYYKVSLEIREHE